MFITLEGIDGCGKSTQVRRIADYLEKQLGPHGFVVTKEPGDWSQGDTLRKMLLEGELTHRLSELFLFLVDRCEHLEEVILPALARGQVVLCDRYVDSTRAYQIWGRGLPRQSVEGLFDWCSFPAPDLTLWLDISPDLAVERMRSRGPSDRMESSGTSFLRRVAAGYETLWREEPQRICRLDASLSEGDLFLRLLPFLQKAVEGP